MYNTNNQIRLNAGRFISRCFYENNKSVILFLAYAVISALGNILKLTEDGGKEIAVIFSTGMVIDLLFIFFIIHSYIQGAKKRNIGFMEIPILVFEMLVFLYYMVFGYIRISRTYTAEGFLQKLLGWSYAAYIILFAISAVIIISFLKSQVIIRQASSLIYFVVDMGVIASVLLSLSYFLCYIFVGYTNDSQIIFTLSDTLRIGIAPILLIGYWMLFHNAAASIEQIYNKYYEKLLALTVISDDDLPEVSESKEEVEEVAAEQEEVKLEETPTITDIPQVDEPLDIFDDKEIEIPEWAKSKGFDTPDEEFDENIIEDKNAISSTDNEPIEEQPKEKGSNKFLSVLLNIVNILGLGILLILFCLINFIPYLIKGVIIVIASIIKAFGWLRYKLTYSILLITSDGKIPSKKLHSLSSSKQKCYNTAEKITTTAGKIKTFKFKKYNKNKEIETEE